MSDPKLLRWSPPRLADALEQLATLGLGLPASNATPQSAEVPAGIDLDRVGRWVDGLAAARGLRVGHCTLHHHDLAQELPRCGPALLRLGDDERPSFLVLVGPARRGRLRLLDPRGRIHRVGVETVARWLRADEAPVTDDLAETAALLGAAGVRGRPLRRALGGLRGSQSSEMWDRCWTVHVDPAERPLRGLLTDLRAPALAIVVLHTLLRGLWLAAWAMLARLVFGGATEPGWIAGWIVALLCTAPVSAMLSWLLGDVSVRLGLGLKRRVLAGMLALDPDALRREAGEVFARVQESQEVETRAVGSALWLGAALLDVTIVAGVLFFAGAITHAAAFLACVAAAGLLLRRHRDLCQTKSERRLALTSTAVEHALLHRTRALQQTPDLLHAREDVQSEAYALASGTTNRLLGWLHGAGRLWLVIALALGWVLVPLRDPAGLATVLGAVLFGQGVLVRLVQSGTALAEASIAMRRIRELLRSERAPAIPGMPALTARLPFGDPRLTPSTRAVLRATAIVVQRPGTGRATLEGCDLEVARGDRLLIEGPSGSGKSTLVSVLGGALHPSHGNLALHALDLDTVGSAAWRASVVCVPQLHQNHIFRGTLAFNLLLGRNWPPLPQDLADAEEVCHEVGLGSLLEAMPGGLEQRVGETGWQLSHGERARVCLARALLQPSDVVILDESLSSLDPVTQDEVLACIGDRVETLVLVAHP